MINCVFPISPKYFVNKSSRYDIRYDRNDISLFNVALSVFAYSLSCDIILEVLNCLVLDGDEHLVTSCGYSTLISHVSAYRYTTTETWFFSCLLSYSCVW